jgi:hypothetical protein
MMHVYSFSFNSISDRFNILFQIFFFAFCVPLEPAQIQVSVSLTKLSLFPHTFAITLLSNPKPPPIILHLLFINLYGKLVYLIFFMYLLANSHCLISSFYVKYQESKNGIDMMVVKAKVETVNKGRHSFIPSPSSNTFCLTFFLFILKVVYRDRK